MANPDHVPRLPRSFARGLLRGPHLFKIAATAMLLFVVVFMRKPCASAAGKFVAAFEDNSADAPGQTQPAIPTPDTLPSQNPAENSTSTMIRLDGTDEEIAAAIAAARARAAAAAAARTTPSAGSAVTP